jgi:thiol-disulfide isomerase/thioredoxin
MGAIFLMLATTSIAMAAPPAADALDLSAYEGKVVVVDFWASWCVPCRRSFPWMNQMQEKYADEGLVIIAVNMDADAGEAEAFLRDYPASFKIVYDNDGALAGAFGVIAMPSSYVIDRNGNQVARHLGFKVKQQGEYEDLLVETLQQ